MKPLKIEDIPEAGLSLDEALGIDYLAELLPLKQGYAPKGVGQAKLFVQKQGQNIVLNGTAKADVRCQCASCLKEVSLRLAPKIDLVLFRADGEKSDDDIEMEGFDEDGASAGEGDGAGEYDGKVVDWPEIVREALVLAIPIAPRCTEACKGLCPVCGKNKNEEECSCVTKQMDPRWEKLKHLKLDGN